MKFVYCSLGYAGALFRPADGTDGRDGAAARNLLAAFLIACLITCIGGWAGAGAGALRQLTACSKAMARSCRRCEHLRSGHDMNFALGQLSGRGRLSPPSTPPWRWRMAYGLPQDRRDRLDHRGHESRDAAGGAGVRRPLSGGHDRGRGRVRLVSLASCVLGAASRRIGWRSWCDSPTSADCAWPKFAARSADACSAAAPSPTHYGRTIHRPAGYVPSAPGPPTWDFPAAWAWCPGIAIRAARISSASAGLGR